MKHFIYFLFCFLLLTSCKQEFQHPVDFYYWRSNYSITPKEKNTIEALKVKNIYVRLFDVDKIFTNPTPIGVIKGYNPSILNVNYIPTVFITNRTFKGLTAQQTKDLAKNVHTLIVRITETKHLSIFQEIQIDCDWTKSTRENYFLFLRELKFISGKQVSATLRMHQVKFKDVEGIPPLEKMVLMCYATENPSDVETKNSILDLDLAKDYLKTLEEYPVHLDVALPLYSWAIITNHLGKIKLVNSFSEEDLIGQPVIDKGNGIYEVTDDFFVESLYLSRGFQIKIETISPELLSQTKEFLEKKLKNDFRIIYYHLDEKFIQNYNLNQF